jgi:hypothetical protein
LAYRLATGRELDPGRDFAGGLETVRFFTGLGFVTRHDRPPGPPPPAVGAAPRAAARPAGYPVDRVRTIALVSHDYNVTDGAGRDDYSEHFDRINRVCDRAGCDTILYSLYTWDRRSPVPRTAASMFAGLARVHRIVLELYDPPYRYDHVEVWRRGHDAPLVATQRFATSTAPRRQKQAFLDDLPARQTGDAVLVLCGESNIASLVRGADEFHDPFGFADRLTEMGVRVVLNPIHDYMRRYEMRGKRRYYSLGGRTVVSVWNRGAGKEARLPWTVFHDGEEYTAAVRELDTPFDDRPDIRIGVLDLATLTSTAEG